MLNNVCPLGTGPHSPVNDSRPVCAICPDIQCDQQWVSGREASARGSILRAARGEGLVRMATSHERLLDSGHWVWTPAFYGKV